MLNFWVRNQNSYFIFNFPTVLSDIIVLYALQTMKFIKNDAFHGSAIEFLSENRLNVLNNPSNCNVAVATSVDIS